MPVKYANDSIEMRQQFGVKLNKLLQEKGVTQSGLAKLCSKCPH